MFEGKRQDESFNSRQVRKWLFGNGALSARMPGNPADFANGITGLKGDAPLRGALSDRGQVRFEGVLGRVPMELDHEEHVELDRHQEPYAQPAR